MYGQMEVSRARNTHSKVGSPGFLLLLAFATSRDLFVPRGPASAVIAKVWLLDCRRVGVVLRKCLVLKTEDRW